MPAQTVGQKIRMLRAKRKMSGADLAHALGITQQLVSSWERGEVKLRQKRIQDLAIFFHVNPSFFFPDWTQVDEASEETVNA